MATRWCQRCYELMVASFEKEYGNDKRVSMQTHGINFSCKVPIYESDDQGRPTVTIWDCKNQITLHMSQEAYERMQRDEEV